MGGAYEGHVREREGAGGVLHATEGRHTSRLPGSVRSVGAGVQAGGARQGALPRAAQGSMRRVGCRGWGPQGSFGTP